MTIQQLALQLTATPVAPPQAAGAPLRLHKGQRAVLEALSYRRPRADYEIAMELRQHGVNMSGPAITARLRELAQKGLAEGTIRRGKRFKEWRRVR